MLFGKQQSQQTSSKEKPMQDVCLFYDIPVKINELNDVKKAIEVYKQYDVIIWNEGTENPANPNHQSTVDIIKGLKALKKSVVVIGYVPIGAIPTVTDGSSNLALSEIDTRIKNWKDTGADGIFLDEYGYDYYVTRERQNACIQMCRSRGMVVCANTWSIDDAFSNKNILKESISFNGNPNEIPCKLTDKDYIIFENHLASLTVNGTTVNQLVSPTKRTYQAIRYKIEAQTEYGGKSYFDVYKTKGISLNGIQRASGMRMFLEAYMHALAMGCDGYCASPPQWGASAYRDYVHFTKPDLTSDDIKKPVLNRYELSLSELSYSREIGASKIEAIWNQQDKVTNPETFTNTKFTFQYTIGSASVLNVDSSIEVQLNKTYFYPALTKGDTAEAIATKIAAANYGTKWKATATSNVVVFEYQGGNPENYTSAGNTVYISASKGVTGTTKITVASTTIRRVSVNGEFLYSKFGSTATRPATTTVGFEYFDTTLGKPIWWSGSAWKDATGTTV